MNKLNIMIFTAVAGASGIAFAATSSYDNPGHTFEAPVVNSTPIYTTVKINEPVQQC